MHVSVGQVENLQEAVAGLQASFDMMENACQAQIAMAEAQLVDVQTEAENSAQMLESAMSVETEAIQHLQSAQEQLSSRQERMVSAASSLSTCEGSGSYDEDGNYEEPDCSSESGELSEAESAVEEGENAVADAQNAHETAKENRMRMEQRNELACRSLQMATQLAETVRSECSIRLASAAQHLETGKARLANAEAALNAYLDADPEAARFYAWHKWSPAPGTTIGPKDIHERLNLSVEQMGFFLEYLADRDPAFRIKVNEYKNQLDAAKGPAEKHAIQIKIRRNLSGYCGEKIVEHSLGPLGHSIDTQARTTFEDGRYTKTDLIIGNLKVPVILGRGEGMSAPAGGSIAIEVKCGKASYLYSQKDHMIFQSGGHQHADASMTVCTRDVKDLPRDQEQELRDDLRNAGSPLIGMLPTKDEIDKACWDLVNRSSETNGGNHEN